MAETQILDYFIYLTDKDEVARLQQQPAIISTPRNTIPATWIEWKRQLPLSTQTINVGDIGGVYGSPEGAAERYSATLITSAQKVEAPCIVNPWSNYDYPTDQDNFETRTGWWIFGHTTKYIWKGQFLYAPPVVPPDNGPVTDPGTGDPVPFDDRPGISQRSWIDGFEMPQNGEGPSGTTNCARAASRHVDGFGFAYRGSASGNMQRIHLVNENGASARTGSWERIYIRLIALPSNFVPFLRCKNSVATAAGCALTITSTGRIGIYNVSLSSVFTPIGSSDALALNTWYRIDVLWTFGASARVQLFINGISALDISGMTGGLATVGNHANSSIDNTSFNNRYLALDLDDWECMPIPANLTGVDFLNGSRVVRVEVTGLSTDNDGDWDGDWRALLQNPAASAGASILSAVSAAILGLETNGDRSIDGEPGSLGVAAFILATFNRKQSVGDEDSTLAYVSGAGSDSAVLAQVGTQAWQRLMYRPSGLVDPAPVTPITATLEKGADTQTTTVYAIAIVAELLGTWGPEDVIPTREGNKPVAAKGHTGIHNAPYPRTPWAIRGTAPISPFAIVAGTYTGNDIATDLAFRFPTHWIWARHVVAGTNGWTWWSSMNSARYGFQVGNHPNAMVQALLNAEFVPEGGEDGQPTETLARIVGTAPEANADAIVYQFVAVCDPGMRFMLNGAIGVNQGPADRVTTLVKTAFDMDAVFLQREDGGVSTTIGQRYKGPGHGTTESSLYGDAAAASTVSTEPGKITTKSAVHSASPQLAFSAWRMDDGSGDEGIARTLKIGTYTGDGTGARTIDLPNPGLVRPVFALVVAHASGKAIQRDPSHTGTTSTLLPVTNVAANGIAGGGIDQLLVGSDLNQTDEVYDYFVLMGSATAGENGFSINGEFIPVPPWTPTDWPGDVNDPGLDDNDFDDNQTDPGDDGSGDETPGDGGDDGGGGGNDASTGCVAASTQVCNRALALVGVTKMLGNFNTETSVEAEQCKLNYADEVDAVLRAFPWPFATKYATLVLVAGTDEDPVNDDWQYSYRQPSDCIFARRVLNTLDLRRKVDYDPPAFRRGADTTGKLIYTNQANAVLEYTMRPSCAATAGDALFRTAVAARLAAKLAPSIARNKMTATDCLLLYREAILEAKVVAMREKQDPDDGVGEAEWIRGRS